MLAIVPFLDVSILVYQNIALVVLFVAIAIAIATVVIKGLIVWPRSTPPNPLDFTLSHPVSHSVSHGDFISLRRQRFGRQLRLLDLCVLLAGVLCWYTGHNDF